MFCPVCKYEFRRGFTRCNTCDVDLVDALPPEEEVSHEPAASPAAAAQMDRPILLWSGASGGFYSALTLALDDAHVPYNKEELDARMVFTTQHVDLEVWVPTTNLSDAQRVLDTVLANPLYANDAASGVLNVENEDDTSAALPAEDNDGADDIRHESFARELYPEDATAEIWSGKDEMMADVLKSCLAEIGINCYVRTPDSEEDASAGAHSNDESADFSSSALSESHVGAALGRPPFAVRVLPADENRAKQIVRAVTDGVPPQ
ncbi:MAG: hypothetical protein WA020_03295 [Candidatus Acidiferrales bacterium]